MLFHSGRLAQEFCQLILELFKRNSENYLKISHTIGLTISFDNIIQNNDNSNTNRELNFPSVEVKFLTVVSHSFLYFIFKANGQRETDYYVDQLRSLVSRTVFLSRQLAPFN